MLRSMVILLAQAASDFVQQNFGVGAADQVVVIASQHLACQLFEIGQLAIESQAQPVAAVEIVVFKRLSQVSAQPRHTVSVRSPW